MTTKGGIKLILSVSRRTDIPAFYSEWFFNRLKEGYVLVRNPINYNQISKIILNPKIIDCIVFWTKDPRKILKKIDLLEGYNYYFQVTINPYDNHIERNVASKSEIMDSFIKLSGLIGRKKVIWRYDPILLTDQIDINFHKKNFEKIASKLGKYTDRCIISFVDLYSKTERNMKSLNIKPLDEDLIIEISKIISEIASKYNIKVETCSESINLSKFGIKHGKCIDDSLISEIVGEEIILKKDKNQREVCGCVASIDIGAYNTCLNGCLYCYANFSDVAVKNNIKKHDINSPLLIGNLEPGDKITERKMESYRENQLNIFSF